MPAPPSEIVITAELVADLVASQYPALSGPVSLVAHGWDCDTYRLGDSRAVRLPRRAAGVPVIESEQRWLPRLAKGLPLPVPAPEAIGVPGTGYPWPWSIVPWFDGRTSDEETVQERDRFAVPLARFLTALHRPAPASAPRSSYRGVDLGTLTSSIGRRLEFGSPRIARAWSDAVDAGAAPARIWLHGDLHPANVVVGETGQIAAVIDFGDLATGDPAVDVAAAWLFFSAEGRARFRSALAGRELSDAHLWRRARGWAVAFSLGLIHDSDGSARMVELGRAGLAAIEADRC